MNITKKLENLLWANSPQQYINADFKCKPKICSCPNCTETTTLVKFIPEKKHMDYILNEFHILPSFKQTTQNIWNSIMNNDKISKKTIKMAQLAKNVENLLWANSKQNQKFDVFTSECLCTYCSDIFIHVISMNDENELNHDQQHIPINADTIEVAKNITKILKQKGIFE